MFTDLPEIHLYSYFPRKDRFLYAQETYDCSVLFLLTRGCFEFQDNDGNLQKLHSGEAVYCPAGFPFHRYALECMDLHMIKFSSKDKLPDKISVIIFNNRVTENLKKNAASGFFAGDNIPSDVLHYCVDTVIELCPFLLSAGQEKDSRAEALLKFLDQCYTRDITNQMLCQRIHCSEATMISICRRHTGLTPQRYITEKRMELARQLIVRSELSIGEISEKCGYEDSLYFSRLFAKHTGMAATAFRKKYRI